MVTRLLTAGDTGEMDRKAVAAGLSSRDLMATAAMAVARFLTHRFPPSRTGIVCGPGNNGGDGLLAAHRLARLGWDVEVISLEEHRNRRGDAAWAQSVWGRPEQDMRAINPKRYELIVDAVFGAGLNRTPAEEILGWFHNAEAPIVAVDIATGVDGTLGTACPNLPKPVATVSFVQPKIGHGLLPGRLHAGDLIIADIGIDEAICDSLDCRTYLNSPDLWAHKLPKKSPIGHKYDAGHCAVAGGAAHRGGAASMTALAADAIGAGLVTLACDPGDIDGYMHRFLEIMLHPVKDATALRAWFEQPRITSIAIGPALGLDEERISWLEAALGSGKPAVVDADAITILARDLERLRPLLHPSVVLTPHDGEFARLSNAQGSRLERATQAAQSLGVTIVLKGGDCVVAPPSGSAAISTHAPPSLAKAGSGDVLCGVIAGLMAQGMCADDAAMAGVWLHGEAGRFAPNFTASQLISSGFLTRAMEFAQR